MVTTLDSKGKAIRYCPACAACELGAIRRAKVPRPPRPSMLRQPMTWYMNAKIWRCSRCKITVCTKQASELANLISREIRNVEIFLAIGRNP